MDERSEDRGLDEAARAAILERQSRQLADQVLHLAEQLERATEEREEALRDADGARRELEEERRRSEELRHSREEVRISRDLLVEERNRWQARELQKLRRSPARKVLDGVKDLFGWRRSPPER